MEITSCKGENLGHLLDKNNMPMNTEEEAGEVEFVEFVVRLVMISSKSSVEINSLLTVGEVS